MKRAEPAGLLVIAAFFAAIASVGAQDLQPKGVSYFGGQAAKKLYTTPPPGAQVRGRAVKGGTTSGVNAATRSFTQTISSGGLQRQFIVHIPPNYNAKRATPLVMVFHGMQMSADMMPPLTLMNVAADKYGYIVVYPDGYNNCWNDGIQPRVADDVRFVQDMIGVISHNLNVDQRRIFACGLSNGGYFSQRLACDLPNRIAAIGVVAASALQPICASCGSNPTPVIYFLGTDDPLVPRDGSGGKSLGKIGDVLGLTDLGIDNLSAVKDFAGIYSQQEAVDWWAKHNGAGGTPAVQNMPDLSPRDKCKVKREVYGGGRREVDAYIVDNGGHTWPGGLPVAGGTLGRTTQDVNASELMCEFFRKH